MHNLQRVLLLLSIVVASGCGTTTGTPVAPVGSAPQLAGDWISPCTSMSATQAFVLDFDIAEETWAIDYVVYGDSTCTNKFLTVHIEGPYEVGAASKVVAGAYDARFAFTQKTITPHSAGAAGFLESDAGCKLAGFAEGVAKDVSESGCAALGQSPIAGCPADFDLVKLDGDSLTFGSRPADNNMCTEAKRPTALASVSTRRK